MRITIKTIAREAGVSPITVSRALRPGAESVADAKRERIIAIANKLGYQANPEVSRVMSNLRRADIVKYQGTIALIHDSREDRNKLIVPGTYESALIAGMQAEAEIRGFNLDFFGPRLAGMSSRRMKQILEARGIKSCVILPMSHPGGHLSLDWSPFSVVSATFSLWKPSFHRVVPNQYQAIQEIIRQLRHLGYNRIGFAVHPASWLSRTNFGPMSFYSYYNTQVASVHSRVPAWIAPEDGPMQIKKTFLAWFKKWRPEAVITYHGTPVDGFLQSDLKLKIPRDVGVAYLGLNPAVPGGSGIDERAKAIGAAAIGLVVDLTNRGRRGVPEYPIHTAIEGKWIAGCTTQQKK